ncbi:hypothetical protein [Methanothermobacter sp.]|uniref:hypothetical protein n=1 Tax=Methanothermobacter sp. TaxID=1884223 RepID=UPI00260F9F45|nr:hypothetical protein [Methanothermobacter sp.]MDI9617684.1 hypothetical protein [Methanothermobacter sp.]
MKLKKDTLKIDGFGNVPHYFIDYYIPKNCRKEQDAFSKNILKFKKDDFFRGFANIVAGLIKEENITPDNPHSQQQGKCNKPL